MKSSEKEIIASIFYYLFVIYQGFDINRKVNVNKKISPEGSFIINDKLLIKIKKNASQKQLKQFENSVGFAIDEISNQEFYSKLLSGSKANFTKTLMAMDYDKKISLFKNTSQMMREDDKGGACSSRQVMAVLIYAVALLGEDHPISNNLKNGAKQLYGFDFESEPQDFEKKIEETNPQPNPEEKIKKDPLRKGSWVFESIDNLESKGVLKKKNNSKKRQKKNIKNNKIEGINYLIFIPVFYIILLSTVTFINPQNSEVDEYLDLFLQYHSDLKPFGLIFIGFILWLCIVTIFQNLQNRFIITLTELNLFKFLFYFFVILQILNAFLIINQS